MKSISAYVGSTVLTATMSVANAGETPQAVTVAPVAKPTAVTIEATRSRQHLILTNPAANRIQRALEVIQDRPQDISMLAALPDLSVPVPKTAADVELMNYSGSGVHSEVTEQMRFVAGNSRGLRLGMELNLSSTSPKNPRFRSVTLGVGVTKIGPGFILNGQW